MQSKKPFFYSVWFKVILLLVTFIPTYTEIAYDPANTSKVIASVLSNPPVNNFGFFLPVAKILLALAAIAVTVGTKKSSRILLGYYAAILVVIGIFQNMSGTSAYGFSWIIGNTIVMLIVSAFCAYDAIKGKSDFDKKHFEAKRLWVIFPMLLAWLMPYAINEQGIVKPDFSLFVFLNEAGVTYCMITPVIIGAMILFSKGVYKPIFSIISFVGFIFGVMNMLTWFVFNSPNWWMGILHLPLLILSFYALLLCKPECPGIEN